MDVPRIKDFGSPESLLRFIQERSDDLEKVVISNLPAAMRCNGEFEKGFRNVGMILHFLSGEVMGIVRSDSDIVMRDGILDRMKVPIEVR